MQSAWKGSSMKNVCLAFVICGVLSGTVLAQDKPCKPRRHAKLPVVKESTYHKARKKLIAAGWQPLRTTSANEAATNPDITSGNGPLLWQKGYFELDACSGTGVAACAFMFKDAHGNRLRVTTEGEEVPNEKSYARVTGYRFVCE
jgi:hypothetical protein